MGKIYPARTLRDALISASRTENTFYVVENWGPYKIFYTVSRSSDPRYVNLLVNIYTRERLGGVIPIHCCGWRWDAVYTSKTSDGYMYFARARIPLELVVKLGSYKRLAETIDKSVKVSIERAEKRAALYTTA